MKERFVWLFSYSKRHYQCLDYIIFFHLKTHNTKQLNKLYLHGLNPRSDLTCNYTNKTHDNIPSCRSSWLVFMLGLGFSKCCGTKVYKYLINSSNSSRYNLLWYKEKRKDSKCCGGQIDQNQLSIVVGTKSQLGGRCYIFLSKEYVKEVFGVGGKIGLKGYLYHRYSQCTINK